MAFSPIVSRTYIPMLIMNRYDPTVPKLLEARHRCRALMADHNLMDPRTISYDKIGEARLEVLTKALGRVGEGTFIEPPFMPDYGCNIIIGKNCFLNWKCVFQFMPFLLNLE